jgi:hypothetical protein
MAFISCSSTWICDHLPHIRIDGQPWPAVDGRYVCWLGGPLDRTLTAVAVPSVRGNDKQGILLRLFLECEVCFRYCSSFVVRGWDVCLLSPSVFEPCSWVSWSLDLAVISVTVLICIHEAAKITTRSQHTHRIHQREVNRSGKVNRLYAPLRCPTE